MNVVFRSLQLYTGQYRLSSYSYEECTLVSTYILLMTKSKYYPELGHSSAIYLYFVTRNQINQGNFEFGTMKRVNQHYQRLLALYYYIMFKTGGCIVSSLLYSTLCDAYIVEKAVHEQVFSEGLTFYLSYIQCSMLCSAVIASSIDNNGCKNYIRRNF